jgi:hypothetical protein
MQPRLAFTADFWGKSAVLCRALEDCPGPIVDQQFGAFDSWTQANAYAEKLNEGLELDASDARRIVISAMLARDVVLRVAAYPEVQGTTSLCVAASRAARMELLLEELRLAVTLCGSVRESTTLTTDRLAPVVSKVLFNCASFASRCPLSPRQLQEIAAGVEALGFALAGLVSCGASATRGDGPVATTRRRRLC